MRLVSSPHGRARDALLAALVVALTPALTVADWPRYPPATCAAAEKAHCARTPSSGAEPHTTRVEPPSLMLAETYADGLDLARYWVSEKLDGVRGYWDGERFITRGGRVIQAPTWFTARFPRQPLDGELWLGRGKFEDTVSTIRRQEPDVTAWRAMRFMVFDLPAVDAPFNERLAQLQALVAAAANPHLVAVEQRRVGDAAALLEWLEQLVADGGEGLMLHHEDARYRPGRSDGLRKLKPYFDAEARVIAHLPGTGRLTGMMGSILVEDARGQRFRIGTGFSDAQRRDPPPLGSLVTYRYHGYTARGIPRFASFLRVREPE